jgi:hypothetical protein
MDTKFLIVFLHNFFIFFFIPQILHSTYYTFEV